MTKFQVPIVLAAIRAQLGLTQEQLAERLGVSFASVNRWEGGGNKPQKAAWARIEALADEAGVGDDAAAPLSAVPRHRGRRKSDGAPSTKPMEQMLWDAACSIRGE